MGAFIAWDAAAGKKVWQTTEPYPVWSGAVVTAGDVAFYGTLDGWFKAADARTGKVLWQFKVGSGVVGNPITYTGSDGKQYVAVVAGNGSSHARSLATLTPEIRNPDGGSVPTRFVASIAVFPSRPWTRSSASSTAPPGTATRTASASPTSPPSLPIRVTSCPARSHRSASPPPTFPLPITVILIASLLSLA